VDRQVPTYSLGGGLTTRQVRVGDFCIGSGNSLAFILGPCVIESFEIQLEAARQIRKIADSLNISVIFKSSFEKDNRGSEKNYQGLGRREGLAILRAVKEETGLPILTDIHRVEDIEDCLEVVDVLQIPAYLCQQTSLLLAAARSGKIINVKKGQFLAPENMISALKKINSSGNSQVLLTERGSCFGYNRLVSDLRCVPIMRELGAPVFYDATHIVRIYGVPSDDPQGGERDFVPTLVYAGVAAGCDGLFIETHPDVSQARCDSVSQWPLNQLKGLLENALALAEVVRRRHMN
jgi:2-dehydro-3-deoxyphosphooctonate aldolase (KDO 8-P synthase)